MNNKLTNQNNYTFERAILQGRSIADVYLEVMEKSAHSRIEQLSQSSEFHQAIARKFNQVFEHDTLEVMNDYANQCYQRLKYLDSAGEVSNSANDEHIFWPDDRPPESLTEGL